MPQDILQNTATMTEGVSTKTLTDIPILGDESDIHSSSNDGSITTRNASMNNTHAGTFVHFPPADISSGDYTKQLEHISNNQPVNMNDPTHLPDWGETGYIPGSNAWGFNYSSLDLNGLYGSDGEPDPTNLLGAILYAGMEGIDLFTNGKNPDDTNLIINDPMSGSTLSPGTANSSATPLSITDGMHLKVGATLYDLMKLNGIPITNSAVQSILHDSRFAKLSNLLANPDNGKGHMIIWNKTGVVVSAGNNNATMEVGDGNRLYVGGVNSGSYDAFATGNLQLGFKESATSFTGPTLQMDEGSYLSVNGFLGGTADKAMAGTTINDKSAFRTGNVVTQKNVKMDIQGDWAIVGDYRDSYMPNKTVVGENNKIFVGGTLGAYMLASMTIGSDTEFIIGSSGYAHNGEGMFVGSGAYLSTGFNNKFTIFGGMGAGFKDRDPDEPVPTRMLIGDNNSIILTNRADAVFAAEAGAQVVTGSNLYLTGMEISVGYAQKFDGHLLDGVDDYRSATMSIGDNASIYLGSNHTPYIDDSYSTIPDIIKAKDGAIIMDAQKSLLNIGSNVLLQAHYLSIGNYFRNSEDERFWANHSSDSKLADYRVGYGDKVVIEKGAHLTFDSGIIIQQTDAFVDLKGGTLDAGFISMGRYYITGFPVSVSGYSDKYIFNDASNAHFEIGEGFKANIAGGIRIDQTGGQLIAHASASISAKDIYIGSFVTDHKYLTNDLITSQAAVSIDAFASMTIGDSVELNGVSNAVNIGQSALFQTLNGGFMVSGSNMNVHVGSGATLSVAKDFINNGKSNVNTIDQNGKLQANNYGLNGQYNTLFIGLNASMNITSNFTESGSSNRADILGSLKTVGDININGSSNQFTERQFAIVSAANLNVNGSNNSCVFSDGSLFNVGQIVLSNKDGVFTAGNNVIINAAEFDLNAKQNVSFGNNDEVSFGTVNLNGSGIQFNTGSGSMKLGALSLGNSNTLNADGYVSASQVTMGNNTSVTLTSNMTFDVGVGSVTMGTNDTFTLQDGVHFTAGTVAADLAKGNSFIAGNADVYNTQVWNITNSLGSTKTFSFGDNAIGAIGNVNITGLGQINLTTGTGSQLHFGTVTLGTRSIFNIDGNSDIKTLNMEAGGTLNVNASLNLDSLILNGKFPGVINVTNNAVLNINGLATNDVNIQMPTIIIHGGSKVVVNGNPVTRSLNPNDYIVDFNKEQNGIYEYDGDLDDINGHIVIKNFTLGDHILFKNTTGSMDAGNFTTSYKNGMLSIIYNNGTTSQTIATFNYNAANSSDPLPNVNLVTVNGNSYFDLTKCFVLGTHILTPKGEVKIETLSVDDEVVIIQDGQRINRKIVWIGKTDISVDQGKEKDSLYPVRIKAHAFGLNKPHRDLLITPEHTVYIDGGLVPARMLVNGRSIIVDKTVKNYRIYHLETEQHSILLSENLMTESYLNTDNRYLFDDTIIHVNLEFSEHAGHKNWETDAVAPLMVARDKVEPIWQRLDRRATQLGYKPVVKKELTKNPDLCLITQKGERLAPVQVKENVYSFYVPASTKIVAMNSRSSSPSEVIGPFVDDRRTLGVLVSKISVVANKTLTVQASEIPVISGWYAVKESEDGRWTKGLANLPSEITDFSSGDKLIKIELIATALYLIEDHIEEMMKTA